MSDTLQTIISKICVINPMHGKKLRKNLTHGEPLFFERAEAFLTSYLSFLKSCGKDLDYGIKCYLRVCEDTLGEQIRFRETGEYSCKSFADANARVYSNPDVMEYYMHGLLLSQFLWKNHYRMVTFFTDGLPAFSPRIGRYLEIGPGHGLYVSEALRILKPDAIVDAVDISKSSLAISKQLIDSPRVNYTLADIFVHEFPAKYDFITMGEVLEHVEDPIALLSRVKELLAADGTAYITTPANAPAIDHLYLFTDADHIREHIRKAGLEIVSDTSLYVEDVDDKTARELKVPLMYGAFVRRA
jgi:SAM-dependent methyltransferase